MKKFFLSLTAVMLLLSSAASADIYTYYDTEPVMNGVELRHMRRFSADGWLNINAVVADLTEPHIQLELLKGTGVDILTSMAGLTGGRDDVLAASNADFFDNTIPAYSQGFSLGIEYKDGELLQSQIDEDMAAAFYDGARLAFDYMTMSITLTAPNGETRQVRHLNKHTDYYGEILMYTSDWNNSWSPGPGGEVMEVVVTDGIVTDMRLGQPSVIIPDNGYILVVSEGVDTYFSSCFKVGDPVGLNVSVTPSLEGIETAFGGGSLLLKDGQKTEFTHVIAGVHPRTCVGTNADGTVVYIITVDGRQTASKGVTMSELADIALELGCANAMNLDGGGSTRMLARTFWDSDLHVVNLPTENRKVINAVSITTDAVPGPAVGARLKSGAGSVLAGDSVRVDIGYYDENGLNAASVDGTVSMIIDGAGGSYADGYFYPMTGGKASLTAAYESKDGSSSSYSEPLEINVIDRVYDISVPEEINLKVGESYWLTPTVSDLESSAAVNNITLLSPTLGNAQFVSMDGSAFTGVSPGRSLLTLSRDGVTAHCLINVDAPDYPRPEIPGEEMTDPAMGEIPGGKSFGVFAFRSIKDTMFNNLLFRDGLNGISDFTSYGFLGEFSYDRLPSGIRDPIKAERFVYYDKGFVLEISLPPSGRLTGENWQSMTDAVNSTEADTIVILTKTLPNGASPDDERVFYDYFNSVAETKNVYIVTPGLSNTVTLKGKVRLLTLADSSDYTDVKSGVENAWILRFTVDGGECRYRFVKLY